MIPCNNLLALRLRFGLQTRMDLITSPFSVAFAQAADRIHSFILSDDAVQLRRQPKQLLRKLSAEDHPFASNEAAKQALDQLHLLFDLLQSMQALDHIAFDLTLAR